MAAQGLSRALSAFLGFMREGLDRVIKADQCAQYVDDIGIAANDADQLIKILRATFECIRKAGLKLTIHKCHFGATTSIQYIIFLALIPTFSKVQKHKYKKMTSPNFE